MNHYYLRGKRTYKAKDLMDALSKQFGCTNRIASDEFETVNGPIHISTVFLGFDHRWGSGPKLLFETMIFGGIHNQYQRRYSTYGQAEKGHSEAITLVLKTQNETKQEDDQGS